MSNRQNVAALVAAKVEKMNAEVAGAPDLDAKSEIYNRFNLFFAGASAFGEAVGAEADEIKPITAAMDLINKRMDLLDAEAALAEAMGG